MKVILLIVFSVLCSFSAEENNEEYSELLHLFEKSKIEFDSLPKAFDSYVDMTELEDYPNVCDDYKSEECASAWLEAIDIVRKRNSNRLSNLSFRYLTDINEQNSKLQMKYQKQNIKLVRKLKIKLLKFKWHYFQSEKIRRIFKLLTPTIQSKNESISKKLLTISHKIKDVYNHGRPCYKKCLKEGELGIVEVFRKERDYDTLSGFWTAWRNVTGRKLKDLFVERMNLENVGAKENGYNDAASFQLKEEFEQDNFNETILKLYGEILPLYQQLHGYVRYCLAKVYPNKFDIKGPIPAHILGNVWAQQWNNILPILQKCRVTNSTYNIQDEANKRLKNISVKEMFKMSEEFYTSMGLYKMTPYFWQRSVLSKQPGKLMDCHGSASNFLNGVDYRIKMCTENNINDFTTIHHEMGHIEYYMAYRNLPFAFQGAANPGFHEAIGDTIALSVKTPEHLKKVGLIPTIPTSESFDIDYLLTIALEKVAFLPFALTMDSYLWSVYNGSVPYNKLNGHWWNLRYRFQGIKPPVPRTEDDFDPGAKYHMAFGRAYIRYFVSFIHQFQFYEAMCKWSSHCGPLHRCDFYESELAGEKLLNMLKKGQSQHWKETISILTDTYDISSRPLLKYFNPLYKWLKETNEKLNVPIGW